EQPALAFNERILEDADKFLGVAREWIWLEVDPAFAPFRMPDGPRGDIFGNVAFLWGQHAAQDFDSVRRVLVRIVLGEQLRGLGAVLTRPQLRLDHGVDDLLRPFRPLLQVLFM